MKAKFELKIHNDVTLEGTRCSLEGTIGQEVVTLVIKGQRAELEIQFSASELVLAASRLAGDENGHIRFPTPTSKPAKEV